MPTSARAPLRIDLAGGWTDVPAFADDDGGHVVNVTIDKYVRATLADDGSIAYEQDVAASGLGSSACEHVLAEALHNPDGDLDEIAEAAFAAETAEGVVGGRQDQYAACYGGLNSMVFSRAKPPHTGPVRIERLAMPESHVEALQKRLVLVDSGIARLSGEIHQAVWSAYARHDDDVTGALVALRNLGKAMRDAIAGSDFGGIRQVLNENWLQQKRLHPTVTNSDLDALFELAMRKGASAGKACGAGGGGAVVFYASSDADGVALRQKLRGEGVAVINTNFSFQGLEDL